MSSKVFLLGCVIIAASILCAGKLARPGGFHGFRCRTTTAAAVDRRDALAKAFVQQLTELTPSLGNSQEIKRVEVVAIALDGDTLTIIPRVWWTKQDSFTEYPCKLQSDGFGGFTGKYSPLSDNTKNIWITLK
jgi:hypothetical protein